MKVFVFALAMLMAINSSAQTSAQTADSLRVQSEAKQFLDSLLLSYTNEGTIFKNGISSQATNYYNAFINARRKTGESLRTLGTDSQIIASKYINELNYIIFTLQSEFSAQSIELRLQRIRLALNNQYINRLQSDITTLGQVVNANPNAIKCWDENKPILKALLDLVVQQFQYVYRSDLESLVYQVRDIAALVNNEVARIEKDVETNCPLKGINCIIKYYTDRSAKILKTFGNYADIALNGLKGDILNGTATKGVGIVTRSFQYYEDYNVGVVSCIASS